VLAPVPFKSFFYRGLHLFKITLSFFNLLKSLIEVFGPFPLVLLNIINQYSTVCIHPSTTTFWFNNNNAKNAKRLVHNGAEDVKHLEWIPFEPDAKCLNTGSTACALGDYIYFTGGKKRVTLTHDDAHMYTNNNMCCRFDPVRNTWLEMAPMVVPRRNHSLTAYNGCLYAYGGCRDKRNLYEIYYPESNSWALAPLIASDLPCYKHSATLVIERANDATLTTTQQQPKKYNLIITGGWNSPDEFDEMVLCSNVIKRYEFDQHGYLVVKSFKSFNKNQRCGSHFSTSSVGHVDAILIGLMPWGFQSRNRIEIQVVHHLNTS
jgi:hypothetical protein